MSIKKKYKGVIFDLDGTLLNTLGVYTHIINMLMKKNNFPTHTIENYREFIGNGTKNLITRSIPEKYREEKLIDKLLNEFRLLYENMYTQHTEVYIGVLDILDELQSSEIKLALLSNKFHDLTCKCANHFFPNIKFDAIIGQSDLYKKPDPKGALDISHSLKIPLDQLVLVGDTEVDIRTAKNAGIDSIAVTWGFRKEEDLITLSPDCIIKNSNDLKKYFSNHTEIIRFTDENCV
ncbi:HAD family hydrolase [Aquimarina muelleri]|uniref:phosphoglycolate phosphatase n=1 Tax=Aquimarina muelleri TaxID=279356 RepID=A0A918JS65_9FLAO|nr:HAD family hydrolase [Aquimarina muelleri]MCX2762106.1 HAD family hydrolase [Aquimarina muelleri]GGX04525.1 phosphoglycolate phosphatase [Aquimarina muelleri]